jgi:hypothetical protein
MTSWMPPFARHCGSNMARGAAYTDAQGLPDRVKKVPHTPHSGRFAV